MKNAILVFLKGLWIGATMTVPGVSGGTMAIALDLYDRLIAAVGSLFKKPKESLRFLLQFSLGAGIGIVLFSGLISYLFTTPAELPLRFFFLGTVAGGLPVLFRKAGVTKLSFGAVLYPMIGVLILLIVMRVIGRFNEIPTLNAGFFMQLTVGILIAAALILPGISASQILYLSGMYESVLDHIRNFRFVPLLPAAFGVFLGILLLTSLLNRCLTRHASASYLIIFGFMVGSLPELFPASKIVSLWDRPILLCSCVPCAVIGFLILFRISRIRREPQPNQAAV